MATAPKNPYQPVGAIRHTIGCCGLKEYYGINQANWTPEGWFGTMIPVLRSRGSTNFGVMMLVHKRPKRRYRGRRAAPDAWTKSGASKKLLDLQAFVKKYELGQLTIVRANRNPNSGNDLKAAIFLPDQEKLRAHANRISRAQRKTTVFTPPITTA